jgi:hypothetical protein
MIKIRAIRERITMCPANIFAKSRILNTADFIKNPKVSINTIKNPIGLGVPCGNIFLKKPKTPRFLNPALKISRKTIAANAPVTLIFPVAALNAGISPT